MRWALHGCVCAVGLWFAFRPTIESGFARMQADPGDTVLNQYILEHSWLCLTQTDYVGTWWSPPCFYPQPLTLAYSENLFGTAPVYWLLRTTFSDALAFQLWLLAIAALTYFAMAWTLQQFGIRPLLAALGAYLFAFGLPRITQIGHQQMWPQLFAPLALLCILRFLQSPSVVLLAGALVMTLAQVLASIYLGWFLVLGIAVLAIVSAIFDRSALERWGAFLRNHWLGVTLLLAISAGVLAAILLPYFEANRGFRRPFSEVREMVPGPRSWLAPPIWSIWFDVLPQTVRESNPELWIFPGFVAYGLAATAMIVLVVFPKSLGDSERKLAWACLWTALILVILSQRWGVNSPWYAVWRWCPGGQAIRAVGRIWTITLPLALIASLIAVDRWLDARLGATLIALVLLGFGVAEQLPVRPLPSFAVAQWNAAVESVRGQMKPGAVHYVELMPKVTDYQGQLIAMWAGLKANVPVVNGYSGRFPNGYPDWKYTMTDEQLRRWYPGPVKIIRPAAWESGFD